MIRYYVLVFWLSLNGFHCLQGQSTNRRPVVVIDPGHGGTDFGALSAGGIKEKDVVLRIAHEILRLNREVFENRLEIYATRYSDTLILLSNRSRLAKTVRADVFISIHCNRAARETIQGLEVYVDGREGIFLKPSIWLAHRLHTKISQRLGLKGRGIKFADFQVLRETRNSSVGVLLELGFMSNAEEEKFIAKQGSSSAYALAIIETLLEL